MHKNLNPNKPHNTLYRGIDCVLVGNYRIKATGSVECQQSGPDFTVEKSKENSFSYPPSGASS